MRYLIAFASLALLSAGVAAPARAAPSTDRNSNCTTCKAAKGPGCSDGNCPCKHRCALPLFGPEHTKKLLSRLCGPADCAKRAEAVRKLGSRLHADFCKDPGVLDALINVMLFDKCPQTRQAAAWSIWGQRGSTSSGLFALYVSSKTDPNDKVRARADEALHRLTASGRSCTKCLAESGDRLIAELQARHYQLAATNAHQVFAEAQATWLASSGPAVRSAPGMAHSPSLPFPGQGEGQGPSVSTAAGWDRPRISAPAQAPSTSEADMWPPAPSSAPPLAAPAPQYSALPPPMSQPLPPPLPPARSDVRVGVPDKEPNSPTLFSDLPGIQSTAPPAWTPPKSALPPRNNGGPNYAPPSAVILPSLGSAAPTSAAPSAALARSEVLPPIGQVAPRRSEVLPAISPQALAQAEALTQARVSRPAVAKQPAPPGVLPPFAIGATAPTSVQPASVGGSGNTSVQPAVEFGAPEVRKPLVVPAPPMRVAPR